MLDSCQHLAERSSRPRTTGSGSRCTGPEWPPKLASGRPGPKAARSASAKDGPSQSVSAHRDRCPARPAL